MPAFVQCPPRLPRSRYFYLIVFAMYVREIGPKEFPMTFKQWMEAKGDLVEMIAEGRSKLEWERKIPDEKLVELKELLDAKDFKPNLSRVSRFDYTWTVGIRLIRWIVTGLT